MANNKRKPISFPELDQLAPRTEPRGRRAILRSVEEVEADEAQMLAIHDATIQGDNLGNTPEDEAEASAEVTIEEASTPTKISPGRDIAGVEINHIGEIGDRRDASLHARKQASKRASEQGSVRVSRQASKQDEDEDRSATPSFTERQQPPGPLASDILDTIGGYVSERATVTNAFRYTEQELSWLTDALYEVTKRHNVKLTKQDVARLGLIAVLWDYRTRGDDSLLGEMAIRKKGRGR